MDRHSRVAVHRTPVLCADGAPPGQQVYSHIPNALWANVRNFPGSPGILRAHKRWGPDQLPGNDSNEDRVRRAIPRASAIHTCAAIEATQSPERPGVRAPKRSWLAQRTSPRPRYLQGHRLLVPRRGHHRAGRARPGPGRGAKSATSPAPPSSSPTSSTATSHEVR